jgi:hypothetical protein
MKDKLDKIEELMNYHKEEHRQMSETLSEWEYGETSEYERDTYRNTCDTHLQVYHAYEQCLQILTGDSTHEHTRYKK